MFKFTVVRLEISLPTFDVPLQVKFMKVSKEGKVLNDKSECMEWEYLVLLNNKSLDSAAERLNDTAVIHRKYFPAETTECKYVTCCIQNDSVNKWNCLIQASVSGGHETCHDRVDLDRLVATCITKQFKFMLYAHPDAL